MIPRWVEKYIGVPFSTDDNGLLGTHCYGLVRMIFAEQLDLQLPSYGAIYAKDLLAVSRQIAADCQLRPWFRVQKTMLPFDVVVMTGHRRAEGRLIRAESHCGVAVSESHILHVEDKSASVCVPVKHPSIAGRITEIYRHEASA